MSADVTNAALEDAECTKCGSLLPSGDEGLCQVCGRAFGRPTDAIPVLTPEVMRRHGFNSADARAVQRNEEENAEAAQKTRKRLFWIAAVLVAIIAVLSGLLALSL